MLEKLEKVIEDEKCTAPYYNTRVFHYTYEPGYVEICRSRYLKINSHIFLNKKDETNKELQIAKQLIISQLQNHKILKDKLNTFNEYINKLIIYTASLTNEQNPIMSKHGDFCLEFNSNLFHQFARTEPFTMFGNVIYELEKQQRIVNKMFKIYDQFQQTDKDADSNLFFYLTLMMPLFKNNKHHTDKECRIIQTEIFNQEIPGKLGCTPTSKKIHFALREILNVYHQPKKSCSKIAAWLKTFQKI